MKKYTFPIALFFLTVLLVSCGGNTNQPQEKWLTLEQDNYSISYPKSWAQDTNAIAEVAFSFLSPRRDIGDNLLDNVSLVISDRSSKGWGLDSFVTYMEIELPVLIDDLNFLKNERISDGAAPYHLFLYTGKFGGNEIKYEQRFWVKEGIAYTLAFSASKQDYEWYMEDAKKMMDSFVLN